MAKFDVGVVEYLANSRLGPNPMVRNSLMTAQAARADSLWVPDHLNSLFPRSVMKKPYVGAAALMPRPDACLEPWTMLGNIAAKNRIRRLKLGLAVTDTGRRNPAVTAQAVATLHLLTKGRAILGIGTGEREGNEPYGVDWAKPVGRFIEAMATIRALWNSGGKPVTRDSEFYPLHNATFDLPPYKGKWPEVWVASHRPRMLRATGRYADGWFPAALFEPADYKAGLETVRAAASDSGRDPTSISAANFFYVVTGRSRDDIDEALDCVAMKTFGLLVPGDAWQRHGGHHPMGDGFGGYQDIIPQVLDEQTVLSYTAQVPVSLLQQCLLTGTPDEIVDQVAEWRDFGLEYGVFANASLMQPSFKKAVAASAPFLQMLRKVRKLGSP
ncbi:LLM class flavin-dependent oxidoreductase [Mycolicibacterium agri]|uniref:LLM class flavin-dependent oxidoreductase n=1 Tax=Mycolicibacterium agri TaxID=36811 RepID=A0A2A7N317_MYCAG|nr:LLM class flavin-dependent oxidoreductase [Mycolicibacterium agri]PEG37911.1 LLM class flavin-dependent oxidoreductase [Mycolicibacterium agri]GFG54670.1 phthiodiolone/phenolphthiodiolone dimycocerosates ketoreductase [Mycolicibacterium agri]